MESRQPLNFLNGKRSLPSVVLRSIEKRNPATGAFMFDLPCTSEEDVKKAIKNAQEAFHIWSKKCPRQRGQVLLSAANQIRKNLEEIASAEVIDTGKPIWEARIDIAGCADVLEYFGGIASTISGTHHQLSDGNFAMVQREPLGVVAGIGAWNYPFQVMTWKAAPALICGNAFVYKPSEFTSITSVVLAEILTEAGVPPGAVNIVQVCSNCTRVFVQKSVLKEFTDNLVNSTKKLKIGDPFDEDTKGASVACGGERIVPEKENLKGFFISPCVLTNCNDDMTVVKEEIFGPVVSILPFDNEEEAVARANVSPFGLAAGVMTKDIQRAHRVANALQAGIVWINNYNMFPQKFLLGDINYLDMVEKMEWQLLMILVN
ncbi:4-trimethylaminobutyraldehyde dehydrogenase [Caerostris extrusa]|uniref:4-trimethylaminobutyraldehyde dehydrogenase n=1 Tax=Caerostris extrusa TaxID=172846 RepID=A0AAV4SSW0_CAEEX|nr:4-trimethylaminobutyraldehyde dehydrogenase [Caerostris extrusa]